MQDHSEQSLGALLADMWHGRVFMLIGLMVGMVCAFGFSAVSVPHKEAAMILAPASPMQAPEMPQQISGFNPMRAAQSDMADLNFSRFEAVMKGASVSAHLLKDERVMQGLRADRGLVFEAAQMEWSAAQLSEYIAQRVHIDPVRETALRVFSYQHASPEFAEFFLSRLHETADGLIRHGQRKEVSERIAYLQGALGQTLNPEHRRALTDLLMRQESLRMMVSIEQPFAAAIIEPASPSVKTAWPDLMLVVPVFAFVGAFLGFIVFSARTEQQEQTQERRAALQGWLKGRAQNQNTAQKGPLSSRGTDQSSSYSQAAE